MGVQKEYECRGHGYFVADTEPARCPHGCKAIVRVFTKAPAVKSNSTTLTDKMTRWQAQQMGLTDMSNRHGRTITENRIQDNWRNNPLDMRPRTMELPKGGSLSSLGTFVPDATASQMVGGRSTLRPLTTPIVDPRGDPK